MATGNIAKNDITGRYIKSEPPTSSYRDGHDAAFGKKPLCEWLEGEEISSEIDLDTLVGYSEYLEILRNNKQQ
jgi:hypothetical protein